MTAKVVTRSVRLDRETDERLEAQAAADGVTVSELIRRVLDEATERDARRRRLEAALRVAATLPDRPEDERAAMWGGDTRVPR